MFYCESKDFNELIIRMIGDGAKCEYEVEAIMELLKRKATSKQIFENVCFAVLIFFSNIYRQRRRIKHI